ncbi:MAG: carbohydrate kinase family protein [Ignavibacteriaceae bacterium]
MDILIIGHSVEDHIFFRDRQQEMKPGGIFYSAAAFSTFADPDDNLILLTSTEKSNYQLFDKVYSKVNLEFTYNTEAIPKNHLMVFDDKERHEKYENITDKLKIGITDFKRFDGIYVNMITGFDISMEDATHIRNNFRGPMFIDVHTLSRGIEPNYVRNFRMIPQFDEWGKAFDIIQVNENELLTLSSLDKEPDIAKYLFSLGVKVLIITKGEKGVTMYYVEKEEIRYASLDAIDIVTVNRIGCGDMFGSVFFYYYLKTKDLRKSLELANLAAGCLASYADLKEIGKLKNDVFTRYYKEKNPDIWS